MIEEKSKAEDATGRHAANDVDGPTLPGIAVVKPNSGGRRFAVDPDEQPTEFLDGFEDAAAEHTAELEALAAGKGTRVTAFFALVWFQVLAFFGWIVDEVATTVRLSARWELDHDRTIARLIVATISALVLAGAGVGWWLA
ncbi:hypothetical protein [Amycolatopsis lurida]|uniref:hypothetical protein n=1 Tax=Amycolatopsis lurida TaxID=31959 RepID=UPI00364E5CEC